MGTESKHTPEQRWPAWWYGPEGQAELFNSEEEVPQGWEDHPSKHNPKNRNSGSTNGTGNDGKSAQDDNYSKLTDAEVFAALDKAGVAFNKKWPRTKLESLLRDAEGK